MAIKTFSSGEVLTAADTNTYLTNSGLVYITTGTASGTATALQITSCFSTGYDNYRIEIINARSSSVAALYFQMLSGSTPITSASYSWAYTGISTLNVSTNSQAASQTSGFLGINSNSATQTGNCATFDILNPYLARQTTLLGGSMNLNAGINGFDIRSGGAIMDAQTSYDGFRILANAGNLTATVRIYGYRQV